MSTRDVSPTPTVFSIDHLNTTARRTARSPAWLAILSLASLTLGCASDDDALDMNAEHVLEEQNQAIILDMFDDLSSGHIDSALSVYSESFLQHNPYGRDGIGGLRSLAQPGVADSPVPMYFTIKRVLADGDLVATHTHVGPDSGDETAGFSYVDIFRLDNGKIVEHWDVTQPIPAQTLTGQTMFSDLYAYDEAPQQRSEAAEEATRVRIVDAYTRFLNDRDRSVLDTWDIPGYIQHNPGQPNGFQNVIDQIEQLPADVEFKVHRSMADGDLVLIHTQLILPGEDPNDEFNGTTILELFRVVDDRIVEHWDVIRPVSPVTMSGRSVYSDDYGKADTTPPRQGDIATFARGDITIHSYTSRINAAGNGTYIIESANSLVIVDSQFYVPFAEEFRAYADSLGKPIERIIITHAHADHYGGLGAAFADVPSYALADTIGEIAEQGQARLDSLQPIFGPLAPANVVVPFGVLEPGELVIDGVTYEILAYQDVEADSQVLIRLPQAGAVFGGDLLFNGLHGFLGPGEFDNWLEILQTDVQAQAGYDLILPGHGRPGDGAVVDSVIKYLQTARDALAQAADAEDYKARLVAAYPDLPGINLIDGYVSQLFPQ